MHIRELTLKTSCIADLYEFYAGILSLDVEEPTGKNQLIINIGNSVLIFESSEESQSFIYHFAFNIPSNKIEDAYEWLRSRVELLWLKDYNGHIAEFSGWNARSLYFLDPAGNIVEFIGRSDLRDSVSSPFSEHHIRNISEVGIVLPIENYSGSVKEFNSKYQLSYFSKQPPMDQFCAIGDDEGLFIVVPEKRAWYPTQVGEAAISPLKVKFQVNEKNFFYQQ